MGSPASSAPARATGAVDELEAWSLDYQGARGPAIRQRIIILTHPGSADRLARRFRARHDVADSDLARVARVRLVPAVDRYDPCRANPFIAHAIACVNGELRRCLDDTSWQPHVLWPPRELALRVAKAREATRWMPDPSRRRSISGR